jgi:hypothetical protein
MLKLTRLFGVTHFCAWAWGWAAGLALALNSVCAAGDTEAGPTTTYSYVAYHFEPEEGWRSFGAGDLGRTELAGKLWRYDFSKGADWLSLGRPDTSLLGKVERIRICVRGKAKGHPVHLFLHTHFMTFHKVVGEFASEEEQELVVAAPPGPGWEWFGGENDGKLHGPLRWGELRLAANGLRDFGLLELISVSVDGSCPANRRCVMVAKTELAQEKVSFPVELRSLADAQLSGELRWVFRTWDRKELGRHRQRVSLPARGEPWLVEVDAPRLPRRLRFLEAEFSLDIPGQEVPKAQAYWLGRLEPDGDAQLRPESPFGMGIYLCRYGVGEMEKVARLARQAGVKWSREDFSWPSIERERGKFDWRYHDELLSCANQNGITVYAIVMGWPAWTKAYTAEGVADYVAFLRELVKHYRGHIGQWEIWNEPNIFFWQGPRELYAELLAKSYVAIKQEDLRAQVLGLSTAGIDFKFIEAMLAKQAPFDVLTIHPYRKSLDDREFIEDLKKVSDLVKLPDGRRRPVWLTEMGWATHVPHNALGQDFRPNSQRAQAELIARTYLCSIVSGVEPRTFWYDFRNDGEDPFYFEHSMGIVHRDLTPKPAFAAYATLARVLKGKRLAGPVDVGGGTFAYNFVSQPPETETVTVLWNPTRDARVLLTLAGKRARLINAVGEQRELKPMKVLMVKLATKVHVDLKRGAPVYIVE